MLLYAAVPNTILPGGVLIESLWALGAKPVVSLSNRRVSANALLLKTNVKVETSTSYCTQAVIAPRRPGRYSIALHFIWRRKAIRRIKS